MSGGPRSCGRRPRTSRRTRRISPSPVRSSPTWSRCVRGDVHEVKAPRGVRGREQHGRRCAVVVQADLLPLSTWLVAPTSTGARPASFRPEIEIAGGRPEC
ncbi:MAG: type II toxin-antitoxin system PemK/MazF family toxin [Phycicoccus sp.]